VLERYVVNPYGKVNPVLSTVRFETTGAVEVGVPPIEVEVVATPFIKSVFETW
jgi:hypothetical protein